MCGGLDHDCLISKEDLLGPVAVMEIKIEDEDPGDAEFPRCLSPKGDVVKEAVPFRQGRGGVVSGGPSDGEPIREFTCVRVCVCG